MVAKKKEEKKIFVTMALNEEIGGKLRKAANRQRRPLTQFLLYYGLEAAERVLKQMEREK